MNVRDFNFISMCFGALSEVSSVFYMYWVCCSILDVALVNSVCYLVQSVCFSAVTVF